MATEKAKDEFDILRSVVDQLNGLSADEQRRVIRWACEKLGIDPGSNITSTAERTSSVPSIQGTGSGTTNIKSFVAEKNPRSDNQFTAVTAYFHRFLAPERKESITGDDLQEAARLAGRARLKTPTKTLNNATMAGLLDNVGRGAYRINTVGENLVALVLPGEGKGARANARKPAKKRRVSKKRKTTRN